MRDHLATVASRDLHAIVPCGGAKRPGVKRGFSKKPGFPLSG